MAAVDHHHDDDVAAGLMNNPLYIYFYAYVCMYEIVLCVHLCALQLLFCVC